jgi:uncharacterized membrane protein (Fun14 family)
MFFSVTSVPIVGAVRAPTAKSRATRSRRAPAPPAALPGGPNGPRGGFGGGFGGGSGGGSGGSGGDSGDNSNSNSPRRPSAGVAVAVAALALTHAPAALAGKKAAEPTPSKMFIAGMDPADFALLFSKEFGISGAVGVGVGIVAKLAAKTAFMVLASVMALLRWLELNDLVDVKWANVNRLVGKTTMLADLNNDGKLDAKDLEIAKAKAVGFFGNALPSAGGLSAGIMLGLKL